MRRQGSVILSTIDLSHHSRQEEHVVWIDLARQHDVVLHRKSDFEIQLAKSSAEGSIVKVGYQVFGNVGVGSALHYFKLLRKVDHENQTHCDCEGEPGQTTHSAFPAEIKRNW